MFFQVNITPKTVKNEKIAPQEINDRRYSLTLAPFQPQTKIELEAAVRSTVKCFLTLRNISNKVINVLVTKKPGEERCITLNEEEISIKPQGSFEVCITWTPKDPGSWRDIIQFTDSRRIKYDVTILAFTKASRDKSTNKNTKTEKLQLTNPPQTSKNVLKNSSNQNSLQNKRENWKPCNVTKNTFIDNSEMQIKRTKLNQQNINIENKENISKYNFHQEVMDKEEKFNSTDNGNTLDFSHMINSSAFSLTPLKGSTFYNENSSNRSKFSPQELHKISSDMPLELALRRETFLTVPTVLIHKGYEGKENFNDSLEATPELSNNRTFNINSEVCATPESTNNRTFEMPQVSFALPNLYSQPGPSDHNFGLISPVTPFFSNESLSRPSNKYVSSSSPISDTTNHGVHSTIKNVSVRLSTKYSDPNITAKDVLEADLWVNSNNRNLRGLDTIIENESVNGTHTLPGNGSFSNSKKLTSLTLEISPPKRNSAVKNQPSHKISPVRGNKPLKDTNTNELKTLRKKVSLHSGIKKTTSTSFPRVRIANLSLAGLNKTTENTTKVQNKEPIEISVKLHDPNECLMSLWNRDPFAATTTEDPFLTNTLYYDEKWMYHQELAFQKWLNALLTPPEHLSADIETACVDIGRVWQSCRLKDNAILAETKETVSARYHTNVRLNTLRKAACAMFHRGEVVQALAKTTACVEKGILLVRSDRDLHRDIGLQKTVLELFLSYNPLWLRIGLETVYGETIPLQSNDDLVGLTRFLLTRFFSDPFLTKHHTHPYMKTVPTFIAQIHKFMLKKFLMLVYFLDYAKTHKLIGHDPCLFHKKASHKDSRSILLTFSREILSGIGDITKVLRAHNYVVTHKQSIIEEYDYAVTNLSTDLRDGVRLCRVMELISGSRDLTRNCRVPAISRLQKVHNVDIALKTLFKCGYTLTGNIDAKSIADGHREKTMSLLWQIIYKYQQPRYEKAAKTVQRWWRAMLWFVRVRTFLKNRKKNAVCVIQRTWRSYVAKRQLVTLREEYRQFMARRISAARVIQLRWRQRQFAIREREKRERLRNAVSKIQKWWRNIAFTRPFVKSFQQKRQAVINIQRRYRALVSMRQQRCLYLQMAKSVVVIQRQWRARRLMVSAKEHYLKLRSAVISVQTRWRGIRKMRVTRQNYLNQLNSVYKIQSWIRSTMLMQKDRNTFLLKKSAVRKIEFWWFMVTEKRRYLKTLSSIIVIQRYWRQCIANRKLKVEMEAVIKIQSWWRFIVKFNAFNLKKSCCVKIQKWWRSIFLVRKLQGEFRAKRKAAIFMQRQRRAIVTRQEFLKTKSMAVVLQRRWRAVLRGRLVRTEFILYRKMTIVVQNKWRAKMVAREERQKFLALKNAVVFVQRRFRCNREMYFVRCNYIELLKAVNFVQRQWRSKLRTRAEIQDTMNKAATCIQSYYRMKLQMRDYRAKKFAAVKIQSFWRGYRTRKMINLEYMKEELTRREEIQCRNNAARKIQAYWKGFRTRKSQSKRMKEVRDRCMNAKEAAQPSATLAYRCESSIKSLQNCKSVGQLSMCLVNLDTITRLLPQGCITLGKSELTEIIYDTLGYFNRSLPWVDVCLQASSILITLAKFPPSRPSVLKVERAIIIVQVLNAAHHHETLTLNLATLFWLLCQDEEYAKDVKKSKDIIWLLTSFQGKISKKCTNLIVGTPRATKIQSLPLTCTPRVNESRIPLTIGTPRHPKTTKDTLLLPSTTPDWGFRQQQPRTFLDINFAITAIFNHLEI